MFGELAGEVDGFYGASVGLHLMRLGQQSRFMAIRGGRKKRGYEKTYGVIGILERILDPSVAERAAPPSFLAGDREERAPSLAVLLSLLFLDWVFVEEVGGGLSRRRRRNCSLFMVALFADD